MRKSIITSLFALLATAAVQAQGYTNFYSDISNNLLNQCHGLTAERIVRGGTKIVVDFQGEWTEDMKGAFNYACEIWEETLPTLLPIRITATLGTVRKCAKQKPAGNTTLIMRHRSAATTPYYYI